MNLRKKLCHKGFTLVEMIVAFAVLGIAVLGIGSLFVTSARSYSTVNAETALQKESQLALNQIEAMLIDSTLGVNYNYVTDESNPATGYHFVLNDGQGASYGATPVSKVLYAFNINETNPDHYLVHLIKWDAATKKLYYKEVSGVIGTTEVDDIDISGTESAGWEFLAEGVESFSIDLSDYDKSQKVNISLKMENKGKEYATNGTIYLRNYVLVNINSVDEIYENVSLIINSTITGVELTANPEITIPGGDVLLTAKVIGTGYPSQAIKRWIVAQDQAMTNIIYDTANLPADGSSTHVTIDTDHIMHVNESIKNILSQYNETIYVQAVAAKDAETDVYSNVEAVSIKQINSLTVTPRADSAASANANLPIDSAKMTLADGIYSWPSASFGNTVIYTMDVMPGNVITFAGVAGGSDTMTDDDRAVNWSIESISGTTVSSAPSSVLNEDKEAICTVTIDSNSQAGSFLVIASLAVDTAQSQKVYYQVNVGDKYSTSEALNIKTDKDIVNRGGSVNCYVELDGTKMPAEDFTWSYSLNSNVTGNPVSIDENGVLTVSNDLSYDYSYLITVHATLKSNPDTVVNSKVVTVPKVYLTISPTLTYATMGQTVYGIYCEAVGLEDYDISWSMSKETNPTFYFTALGYTNITGSKNADNGRGEAIVQLGYNEPEAITYMRVKAELSDNSNYYTTMKIITQPLTLVISGPTTTQRGAAPIQLTVEADGTDYTDSELVTWSIASVRVEDIGLQTSYEGLTIEDGLLTVTSDFIPRYLNRNIYVTVRVNWTDEGKTDNAEYTVTVLPGTASSGSTDSEGNTEEDGSTSTEQDSSTGTDSYNKVTKVTPDKVLVPNDGDAFGAVVNVSATYSGNEVNITWWDKKYSDKTTSYTNDGYIGATESSSAKGVITPYAESKTVVLKTFNIPDSVAIYKVNSGNNHGSGMGDNKKWKLNEELNYNITPSSAGKPDYYADSLTLQLGFENILQIEFQHQTHHHNNNSFNPNFGESQVRFYTKTSEYKAVYNSNGDLGTLVYVKRTKGNEMNSQYYAYIVKSDNSKIWYKCEIYRSENSGTLTWSKLTSAPEGWTNN